MKYKILLVLNFLFTASIGSGFIYYYRETQKEIKRLALKDEALYGITSGLRMQNELNAEMMGKLLKDSTKLEAAIEIIGRQAGQLNYLLQLKANVADISLYEGACEVRKISRTPMETMANQLAKNTCMINMLKKTLKNSFKD